MDDLRMIRGFLEEAPPSAEVVAEGRRRLYTRRSPRPRRFSVRQSRAGLGVVAVAASFALTVTTALVLTVSTGDSPTSENAPKELTSRQVLLSAAEKAAAEPTGRYWHTHVINGQAYHVTRGDYMITGARMEIEQWIARSDRDANVFRSRIAGAVPQTDADRVAWKRAGSPKSWRVLSNGQYIQQSATAQKWDLQRMSPAEKEGMKALLAHNKKECARNRRACPVVDRPTQAQREALADDPKALKKQLQGNSLVKGPDIMLENTGYFLDEPGSPKLRAAVFRVLADSSGIRNMGSVTDARGRAAIALVARGSHRAGDFDTQLLLEPGTYRVLGVQTVLVTGRGAETAGVKPGTVYKQQLFLEMGWTNSAPH